MALTTHNTIRSSANTTKTASEPPGSGGTHRPCRKGTAGLSQINGEIASLSMKCARRLLEGEAASIDDLKTEIAAYGIHRKALLKMPDSRKIFWKCIIPARTAKTPAISEMRNVTVSARQRSTCFTPSQTLTSILETENFDHFCFHYYPETMKDRVTGRNARENIQKIVDECLHFVQNFDMEHDNLLFYGATGVGKTFLTHCIAKGTA